MRTHFWISYRSDNKKNQCTCPKIETELPMLPKPSGSEKRVAISLNNIKQRIELKKQMVLRWKIVDAPKHRTSPHHYLQTHVDKRRNVSKERLNGRGNPYDPRQHHDQTKQIIHNLKQIKGWKKSVQRCEYNSNSDKEKVSVKIRNQLCCRQNMNIKHHFFDQIVIIPVTIGARHQRIRKEKPDNNPRD